MRRGQDFSRTTKTGHRATSGLLALYFLTHDSLPESPKVGLIINKSVGGSVTRHRIARQLRHAVSNQIQTLPPHSQLVIRVLKDSNDYRPELSELLIKAIKRAGAHR
jgi:ribonuclease P protein component